MINYMVDKNGWDDKTNFKTIYTNFIGDFFETWKKTLNSPRKDPTKWSEKFQKGLI